MKKSLRKKLHLKQPRINKKKEFIEEIKRTASMVLESEGDGAKYGNCHLPNHTVKTCRNLECKSVKFCGILKKHKAAMDKLDHLDKEINDTEKGEIPRNDLRNQKTEPSKDRFYFK